MKELEPLQETLERIEAKIDYLIDAFQSMLQEDEDTYNERDQTKPL